MVYVHNKQANTGFFKKFRGMKAKIVMHIAPYKIFDIPLCMFRTQQQLDTVLFSKNSEVLPSSQIPNYYSLWLFQVHRFCYVSKYIVSKCIAKSIYLEKLKRLIIWLIIWNGESTKLHCAFACQQGWGSNQVLQC